MAPPPLQRLPLSSEARKPRKLTVPAERLDVDALGALAPLVRMPDVQRLGYLLEAVGEHRLAKPLADWLRTRSPRVVPLRPGSPTDAASDRRWRVIPNEELEVDV